MRRTGTRWLWALVAGALVLGGCGSSGGGQTDAQRGGAAGPGAASATASRAASLSPTAAASATTSSFALGTCEVTISGGVTATIKSGGGGAAVNSEYWLSDSERLQLAVAVGQVEATVQAKMAAREFVLYPLILNCGDSKTNVQFLASASRQEQFPFGPGKYAIAAGDPEAAVQDGEFAVSVLVNGAAFRSNGGQFEVTRFDRSGVAGTFRLEIEGAGEGGTARSGTVVGRFEMSCTGVTTRGGCAR